MAGITLYDVVKRYGDVTAVDNVSMEVRDGEFVALVGPSGCGKTTTLNLVAGLIDITDGDILETPTQVELAFVQGRAVDLTSRHTQLWKKYQQKYERAK